MIRKTLAFIGLHIGRNQDFYIWPIVLFAFYLGAKQIIFYGTGRQPLSDLAVNLQAIDGYVLQTVPVFLALFWASMAGRFLTWTFKTRAEWQAAGWPSQFIDILTPLTVFIVCMWQFGRHS